MADFVYANVSLPADKSDKVVLAGGEDPLKNVVAADYNAITAALKSARSAILAMSPGATVPGTLYAQPSDVPAGTSVLMGRATDASGSVGVAVDNSIGFTNTNARILSLRNLGTERVWFDKDGQVTFSPNTGIGSLIIKNNTTDIGMTIRGNRAAGSATADVTLSGQVTRTAGKIVSFQNNTAEKSYINKDGVYVGPDAFGRVTVADLAYASLVTDNLIAYTTLTAPRTVTLTHPQDIGHVIVVKDEAGTAGTQNITVTDSGGATNMQGGANQVISANFGSVRLYWNGAKWMVW